MSTDSSTLIDTILPGDSPPPPDSSSSSPPPPSPPDSSSSPPADSSPPPPAETTSPSPPPPSTTPSNPPPESTPSPPAPPKEEPSLTPPAKSSPNVGSPPKSEQTKSPQFSPPSSARNDSPASALPPPASAVTSSSSGSSNTVVIVGLAIAGSLILALIIGCFLNKRKKKRSYYYENERPRSSDWNQSHSNEHVVKLPPQQLNNQWAPAPNYSGEYNSGYSGQYGQGGQPQSPMAGLGFSSQSQFSYEDLAAATSGFSPANLLGQGGFGYVHKGVLPDGRVVAVKSLKSGSGQGEREFQAEVDIISRVHHRHLVSLVGYCIADGQRMLVYEFVANSTMEHHLHGKGQPVMDWSSRVRIATGAAKGLAYLHEDCHPRIIHRDIKAANILLDENFEAMVADFGLAKLTTDNFTHVSTRVMGTFGYLAPEYAASGKLSEKSDVFSFGVMLLELITGRLPVDLTGQVMEDSLVDWARPRLAEALEDGDYSELADPNMEGDYSPRQMASMISCAAGSIRHSAKRRPRMSQIVRALEGESLLAEEGNEIPRKTRRSSSGSGSAATSHDSTYDTVAYNNDMMKFKKMVLIDDDE